MAEWLTAEFERSGPCTRSHGVIDVPVTVAVHSSRRLVGEALAASLVARREFSVVGHTDDWPNLLSLCGLRRPDAIVVELGTSPGEASPWLRRLGACCPATRVVVLYDQLLPAEVVGAREAGVMTFIPHARGLGALMDALRRSHGPVYAPTSEGRLTDRELEVMVLMSAGRTVSQTAEQLGISARTVDGHKRRIYAKLEAANKAGAVGRAAMLGILDLEALSLDAKEPNGTSGMSGATRRSPGQQRGQGRGNQDGGQHTHVALWGGPSSVADRVTRTMLASAESFEVGRPRPIGTRAHVQWLRSERSVTVLVEPTPIERRLAMAVRAPTVVVSNDHLDDKAILGALTSGVVAIVRADRIERDLCNVIALVARGYAVMDTEHVQRLVGTISAYREMWPLDPPTLSPRECDILRSAARGDTVRQTAVSMGVAVKTVDSLQSLLFRKLGVRSRAAALAVAYARGLVPLTDAAVPAASSLKGYPPPK